jgi:phosphotriesterase-related protein
MPVMTVKGEISSKDLGITDIHEHILSDFSRNHEPQPDPEGTGLADQELGIDNLGIVTQNPMAIRDNLVLNDEDVAARELAEFKKAGGKTIVDPTTAELGRNPIALRNISRQLDIHIVTCTGHYIQAYHDASTHTMSEQGLTDRMLEEVTVGIGDTGVRAGIIGELGTSDRIYPDEEKVLRAAAAVYRRTGTPIMVHTDPQSRNAPQAIDILRKAGANPAKISICHLDSNFFEEEYYEAILSAGANIEFDTFGEHFCLHPNYGPSDLDRIKALRRLIDAGFADRIMLGNDICLKCRLHRYGGWGYDHLLKNVVPAMKRLGLGDDSLKVMLEENPRRFLDRDEA